MSMAFPTKEAGHPLERAEEIWGLSYSMSIDLQNGEQHFIFCQVENSLALFSMFCCDGTLCLELGATLLESYAGI